MKLYYLTIIGFMYFIPSASNYVFAADCQNARNQTEMNQCAYSDLDHETKKINKTYNDYRAKLDPEQKQQLKEVQLAWIKFKDLACKFSASGSEGGSIHPTILAGCLTEKTRQRNKELEALANCEEGDMSC